MPCCAQCAGIEREFNAQVAARELRQYHRRGAAGTTAMLLGALRPEAAAGLSLLDIGGGVGVLQHELARAGVARITSVDASPAYLAVQQAEAARLGYADRASYVAGDFVAGAAEVPPSDIVTLDRVICCYHDMPALVAASAARARRVYGAVYPRGTWWNAVGIRMINLLMRLRRTPFRTYLHAPEAIDAAIRAQGLRLRSLRNTSIWTVVVYAR